MSTRFSTASWRALAVLPICLLGALPHAAATPLIDEESTWRYWDGQPLPDEAAHRWHLPELDDQTWKEGIGPFGYGEGNERTTLDFGPNADEKRISYYFRKTFTLDDPASFSGFVLGFRVDDGAIIYVNGREVSRFNMQYVDIDVRATLNGSDEEVWHRNVLAPRHFVAGENLLAVQVLQSETTSTDLRFEAHLSGIGKGLVGETANVREGDPTMPQGVSAMIRTGNVMAIGFPGEREAVGRVEVYERSLDGVWTFRQQLILGDAVSRDALGTSLAFHGDDGEFLLAGLPGRSTSADGKTSTGGVAIFRRLTDGDYQFESFIFPNGIADDVQNFGQAIAVHEDQMLVGAPQKGPEVRPGYAFLYRFGQGLWQYERQFAPEGHIRPSFGSHVTLEGSHAVIGGGRGGFLDGVTWTAALYFYQRSAATWELVKLIEPMYPAGDPYFGGPLVLQGDTLFAGAPRGFGNDQSGGLFIYKRGLFGWQNQPQILEGDSRFEGTFGWGFDAHGNQLAVAETSEYGLRDMAGGNRIHLYARESSAAPWTLRETIIEDDPQTYGARQPVVLLDEQGLTAWGLAPDRRVLAFHYHVGIDGAPTFLSTPASSAIPGATYRYEVRVSPASENLTLEVSNLPPWLSFTTSATPGRAIIEGTPGFDDAGDHVFTLNATLDDGSSQQVVRIRVAAEIPPLVITVQPEDATTITGRSARFVVGISGEQPAEIAWWKNDAPMEGETAPTLTLTNLTTRDAGAYWAVVSNAAGTVESRRATLKVISADPARSILVPDDHVSIADAVNAAGEGFQIFVRPGSYPANGLEIFQQKALRSLGGPEKTTLTEVDIALLENSRLEGFRLEGRERFGIRSYRCDVVGNVFALGSSPMLALSEGANEDAPSTVIERNRFIGDYRDANGETAIYIDGSDIRIANNVFSHVRLAIEGNPYETKTPTEIEIVHNTFNACRQGIRIRTNEAFEIAGNLFVFVDDAITRDPFDKFADLSNIHHNVFFEVPRPLDGNPIPLQEHGNRHGDPRLHNPTGNHLRLGPGSVAIDVGGTLPSFLATDLLGNPRVVGAAADAGAYEFDPDGEIVPDDLVADAPVIRLQAIAHENLWTEIRLEGTGNDWRVDPPPYGIEVEADEGTLPGTLRVRRAGDVSLDHDIKLNVHSGDATVHLPIWFDAFDMGPGSRVLPLSGDPTRQLIISRDWIGYRMADGGIVTHRIFDSISHSALRDEKLYLIGEYLGRVREIDPYTFAELRSYSAASRSLAIQARPDETVLVGSETRIDVYENGESVQFYALDNPRPVAGAFSDDGSEFFFISRSPGSSDSFFNRARLGETEITLIGSVFVARTGSNAPLRRADSGNLYFWGKWLFNGSTLEIREFDEEITALAGDSDLVVLQTKVINTQTGASAPLPWNVDIAYPVENELLLPIFDGTLAAVYLVFDSRSQQDTRPAIDTWTKHPSRDDFILTFRATPGMNSILEASTDGIRWSALPESQGAYWGSAAGRIQFLIPKLNHARRFYRVREADL